MTRRSAASGLGRPQLPVLAWLVVVWVGLWGSASPANLLGGAAVALLVTLAFPLPPVPATLRLRAWPLLVLVLQFQVDLVLSSAQVAWVAVRPRRAVRGGVVAVTLRTSSDATLTLTAEALSLTPGSLIVDVDRPSHTLYVHALDLAPDGGVERLRADVLGLEERIVRALGSAELVAELEAAPGGGR